MKNIKTIIILLMIIIPLMMLVYLAGINNGIRYTEKYYIDSVSKALVNITLNNMKNVDSSIITIDELRELNLDISEFDLEKFRLNNGFDLEQLYKDKIDFYTLDTMNIDSMFFENLELLGFELYLYDLDTVLYDNFYILMGSKDFTNVLTLYNELPANEYGKSNDDIYKIIKSDEYMSRENIIQHVYNLNMKNRKIRMMVLK